MGVFPLSAADVGWSPAFAGTVAESHRCTGIESCFYELVQQYSRTEPSKRDARMSLVLYSFNHKP